MRDIAFFSRLLTLEKPWRVERVSLDTQERSIDVQLVHRRNASFSCPECGRRAPLYDHAPSRSWRHLDHGDCLTWLHAQIPRVDCPVHGIRRGHVPWALPGARFTTAFERHAIDVLLEADILGSTRLLRISWDEAWRIMERAVERGLRAKPRRIIAHLGVDEKAVAKRHRYVTLVCDLDRGTVEYVADDRKRSSLDAYYQSLSEEQLVGIEAVAMDMWEPFIASTAVVCPRRSSEDRIRPIPYHEAHDRRGRSSAEGGAPPVASGGGRDAQEDQVPVVVFGGELARVGAGEVRCAKSSLHLKTGRAWAIKESLRDLWHYRRKGWGLRHWRPGTSGRRTRALKPVVKVARMIRAHLANVLTYFDHRITNATSEGLNSKIQTVKKTPMASGIGGI